MNEKKKSKVDYTLYLCTDRGLMSSKTVEESVERALLGGCTLVQLREKEAETGAFYESARRVKAVTDRFDVPLIINDRLDIALAACAAGLHVGQRDLPAAEARRLLGPDKLLGVSVSSAAEAESALKSGADYLGVGAMYATATKTDAKTVSLEELRAIRRASPLPIVVIGGVNERTMADFAGVGIDGFAVVSAIVSAPDVTAAARALREKAAALLRPAG